MQIPKAQTDTYDVTVFSALLGSAHVKAFRKHIGEIDPWSEGEINPVCNDIAGHRDW